MTANKPAQLVTIIRGPFTGFQARIHSESYGGATLELPGYFLNLPAEWYVKHATPR